jgi:predicted transcriptional regulator
MKTIEETLALDECPVICWYQKMVEKITPLYADLTVTEQANMLHAFAAGINIVNYTMKAVKEIAAEQGISDTTYMKNFFRDAQQLLEDNDRFWEGWEEWVPEEWPKPKEN